MKFYEKGESYNAKKWVIASGRSKHKLSSKSFSTPWLLMPSPGTQDFRSSAIPHLLNTLMATDTTSCHFIKLWLYWNCGYWVSGYIVSVVLHNGKAMTVIGGLPPNTGLTWQCSRSLVVWVNYNGAFGEKSTWLGNPITRPLTTPHLLA